MRIFHHIKTSQLICNQEFSQIKWEAVHGMGAQTRFEQNKATLNAFSLFSIIWWTLPWFNISSWLVVSRLHVAVYRIVFCMLSEVFSHCKLLYGLGQKILRTLVAMKINRLLSTWWTLLDLVPFVQFKKREKNPWRNVNFSKVPGWSLQLY